MIAGFLDNNLTLHKSWQSRNNSDISCRMWLPTLPKKKLTLSLLTGVRKKQMISILSIFFISLNNPVSFLLICNLSRKLMTTGDTLSRLTTQLLIHLFGMNFPALNTRQLQTLPKINKQKSHFRFCAPVPIKFAQTSPHIKNTKTVMMTSDDDHFLNDIPVWNQLTFHLQDSQVTRGSAIWKEFCKFFDKFSTHDTLLLLSWKENKFHLCSSLYKIWRQV